MEDNYKMDYLNKINEFLDGELPSEESKDLFNKLADSPELQEELREFVTLKNMFHQELLEPPKIVKTNLYAKFNLQRSAIFLSMLYAIGTYLRKAVLNPIFAITIVSLLLFTIGYFINQKENPAKFNAIQKQEVISNNNLQNKTIQDNKLNNNATNFNNQVPIISSIEKNEGKKAPKVSKVSNVTVNFNKNGNIARFNTDNQIADAFSQNSEKVNLQQSNAQNNIQAPHRTIEPSLFVSNGNFNFENYKNSVSITSPDYDLFNFLERFNIGIFKSNSKSTISTNLQPLSNPLLNDYNFELSYSVNEHNSFSLELGQENFVQQYTGTIDKSYADITQVYTAQFYGLGYQYNFPEIRSFMNISPYIKIFGGGTSVGPLAKLSTGLFYRVNEKLALQLGFENSYLFYNFQNNWFSSSKYGLIYGVQLGF
jgi:hypothetical protein